ncbi:MAG: DUF72 domain-containing protein [Verrucomicrobia bacterium]|nr:DUF72 domain-containing protein [Verrucomicrobiota bacterium]
MAFLREPTGAGLATLACQGVFVGTSSWKYAGWRGRLYDESRYLWRGKVAESRFEKGCLAEYAEVFKTVCVDAAYYTFPSEKYLEGLAAQVPADFRFGFKVTDEVTVKHFPNLPRFGVRAGRPNSNFLNAELFANAFLRPCERIRTHVGVLIFEFSRFHSAEYAHGADFVADLERFLGALPRGWPYAVELRNRHWLTPEYFDCLRRHDVAHTFNSWNAMPTVTDQMALPDSIPSDELLAARFLLRPGRSYEEAVRTFQPYREVKETYPEARSAGAALIRNGRNHPRRKTYIFVNNRLEGNALDTIAAMLDEAV